MNHMSSDIEMYSQEDLETIRDNFVKEIEAGISGKASSLQCIRNPLPSQSVVADGAVFQVITIGGSHMKKALMKKVGNKAEILSREESSVPIFSDQEVFFSFIQANLDPNVNNLVINLAQALEPVMRNNLLDGKMIHATKEHLFDGLLGKVVGEELENYLKEKHQRKIRISVGNDQVILVLAGLADHSWENLIAGIVGTGVDFGICSDQSTIINLESGGFSKFTPTETGIIIDKESEKPGQFIFEKEVSGRYLICHYNLLVTNSQCTTTEELSQIADEGQSDNSPIAQKLFERSASLIAAQLAGIFQYKKQPNLVCAMEGSVFWHGWHYQDMVKDYLQKLAVPAESIKFVDIQDNSLHGAARLII